MIFFILAMGSSWCLSCNEQWLISDMIVIQNSFIFAFFPEGGTPISIYRSSQIHDSTEVYA